MSRAPVTLSREMKMGLIALLMLALLGGWLVVNNRQQAALDTATPPVAAEASSTPPAATATDAATGSDTQAGVPAAPGGAGEAVTAPPFPVTDPNGSTPDPTVPTPLPSGINPETPLLGLNGHNPFRPVKLEAAAGSAPASAITATQPSAGTGSTSSSEVTISQPGSSAAQIDDALATSSGGAIPLSPLPGAGESGPASTSPSSGVIPVSPIPGATVGVPVPTIPTRTRPAGSVSANTPGTTISIPGSSAARKDDQPAPPPVTAVREPSVTIPGALNQPAAASAQGTGNGANGNGLSTPGGVPQAITDTAAPVQTTPSPSAASELQSYVDTHQMVFDAAVLGPVNTAIFRSDKGFIVATSGQPLPDSKVILKEVTATTATLALEQSTVTLQLDNR